MTPRAFLAAVQRQREEEQEARILAASPAELVEDGRDAPQRRPRCGCGVPVARFRDVCPRCRAVEATVGQRQVGVWG